MSGTFKDGNFLYVTDELKEALHYARIKGGNVYKLKDEYNHIVSWAMGQSEGMISQEDLKNNGGFNNVFELFIDLTGKKIFQKISALDFSFKIFNRNVD